MIRAFIDGNEISGNFEVDFSFVEKLDRELDEGFIVLSHTDRKEQFPMFSNIEIFEDQTLLFSGRISDDLVKLSSFSDEIYNHNITIIEHTKILEKYIVNGKTFTQPVVEGVTNLYTLYDVVKTLQETVLFEKTGQQTSFSPFEIPNETKEILEDVISPEFSFKDLTLRQALDEVANVINAITRLDRNGEIFFDRFNELKNEITVVTENFRKHQNIQNYSTIMSSDIINPIQEYDSGSPYSRIVYPGENLWTSLRSRFGQFDFTQSYIPTDQPIYQMLKVKTKVTLYLSEENITNSELNETVNNEIVEIDITDNIVEKNIFNTLEERSPVTYDDLTKRNVIFYNYGRKNIQVGETFGLFDTQTAFFHLVNYAVDKYLRENNLIPSDVTQRDGPLKLGYFKGDINYDADWEFAGTLLDAVAFKRWKGLFNVEYIPVPQSIRYEVMRDDLTDVDFNSYGIINQKMRIVDINSFTNNMKGRINQLSAGELILSHKVKNISDSWDVGDFTADRFVITKKEVIAQRDHYIINYELNKNFNKISQFIGIDQEIRQWEIGEAGRSLDRDLNYNEYIEMSLSDSSDEGLIQGFTINDPGLFLDTFDDGASTFSIKYGTVSSPEVLDGNGNPLVFNFPYYKISGGGSFGFHSSFDSNASAGLNIVNGDDEFLGFEDGRGYNVDVKYTDEIGRFDTMIVTYENATLDDVNPPINVQIDEASRFPLFSKETINPLISGDFYVKKDNRERLKFTLLYHLISKNVNELIVGNKLSTHNYFFIDEPNEIELRLWNNKVFTTRDATRKLTDQDVKITNPSLTINKNLYFINIDEDLSSYSSWALTDSEGNPYLISNSNKPRIIFEFRNKRSGVRYVKTGERLILDPPEVLNVTRNATSIDLTLKNTNDEEVEFQVGSGSIAQFVNVNADTTINVTIPNLIPNFLYPIFLSSNPLENSLFARSDPFNINVQTSIPVLDVPTFNVVDFRKETSEVEPYVDDENGNVVNFTIEHNVYEIEITNTNNYDLDLIIDTKRYEVIEEDGGAFNYTLTESSIPANGTLTFDLRYVENPNNFVVGQFGVLRTTKENLFTDNFRYDVTFTFKTNEFQNNFYSQKSSVLDLRVEQLETPEITNVIPQVNNVLLDIKNDNPGSSPQTLFVETYRPTGLAFDTKIKEEEFSISPLSTETINIQGLTNNVTYYFVLKFLKDLNLLSNESEIVESQEVTTLSSRAQEPEITRVDNLTTDDKIVFDVKNTDSRRIELEYSITGVRDFESLGFFDPNETQRIEEDDLEAAKLYTVKVDAKFPGELDRRASDLIGTRPAPPTAEEIRVSGNFADYRIKNNSNSTTVRVFRNPGNVDLGTIKAGGQITDRINGLSPGNNYTRTYQSEFGFTSQELLRSDNEEISFTTVDDPLPPTLSVSTSTGTSITPIVTNPNDRTMFIEGVEAFFNPSFAPNFPINLPIDGEQGVVSSNSSSIAVGIQSNSLVPNFPVKFKYKLIDFVYENLSSSTTTQTLYTQPLPPQISNISHLEAGPDVVRIDFDVFNTNLATTITTSGDIRIYRLTSQGALVTVVEDLNVSLPNDQSTSFSYNINQGLVSPGDTITIEVTVSNPTSSIVEFENYTT